MCENLTSVLFVTPSDDWDASRTPGEIALRALPTACVALFCLVVAVVPPPRRAPQCFTRTSTFVGALASVAASILTWRVFDLLECSPVDSQSGWRWVAVLGVGGTQLAGALLLPRCPRIGQGLVLVAAAGTVVADWALSYFQPEGAIATEPLVSLQQLWCLQAVVLLAYTAPGKHRSRLPKRKKNTSTTVAPVDALAKRSDDPVPATSNTPSWTWFW